MTQVHLSDGTNFTVYESVTQIVHAISAQGSWVELSFEIHPKTKFVVNSNYITWIQELESNN